MAKNASFAKTYRRSLRFIRNQIILCTFGGVVFGFILAAHLGAFSDEKYANVTNWLAVIVASVAAAISFYAVRLVAKTLKATQDTLSATVQMANDQRRIGNAQIRPWVLVSEYKIEHHGIMTAGNYQAVLRIRNFGTTPAMRVIASLTLQYVDNFDENGPLITDFLGHEIRQYLPPSQDLIIEKTVDSALNSPLVEGNLVLTVTYYDIDGNSDVDQEPWTYREEFNVYLDPNGAIIVIRGTT